MQPFCEKGIHLVKTIVYDGSEISVSKEVADFLENDRKRQAAEERSDRRHISKRDSETVLATAAVCSSADSLFDDVLKSLTLEKLHKVIASLSDDERKLIELRFYDECTLEKIGEQFSISKTAVSKRLKKLLDRMRELMLE